MAVNGKAALWYRAKLGWSVIPLHSIHDGACTCGRPSCTSPGKHPIAAALPSGSWDDFKTTPATPEQVAAWWRRWPDANVGLVTGAVSGVFVLDVDPRHGGAEAFANLQAENGILPMTLETLTGGGGSHIFFKHPGESVRNIVNLEAGVDIRGDGGLIILPPSNHKSGNRYQWGDLTKPPAAELVDAPPWLLAKVKPLQATRIMSTPTDEWLRLIMEGAPEGERNMSAAKLAGLLLRVNLNPGVVGALVLVWNDRNQPPLTHDEVLRTVQSVATRENARRAVNV